MKKMISIFFIMVYLASNSAFSEFLKMPLLVEHYWSHTNSFSDLSFTDFVIIHYQNESTEHEHSNSKAHDKLPFHQQTPTLTFLVSTVGFGDYRIKPLIQILEKPSFSSNLDSKLINNYLSSIWQPPQFC